MSSSILVVDDEPGIRQLLSWELRELGHEVCTAVDGADALAQIREAEFDLVISDIRMPHVSGLEVLRSTKLAAPDTEVVVATGFAELDSAIACVREGAFDFIQKPFHTAELLATVGRALERRRMRRTAGLHDASRAILRASEPAKLPQLIVELAMQAMEADDACLMLPDPDGRLYIAHSHSLAPEIQAAVRLGVGERVAGRVAGFGQSVLIPDGLADDPRFADLPNSERVRSSIVYPLVSGGRLIGVLNVNRICMERPFRKSDLDRAAILAAHILLALENARLLQHVALSERLASLGLLAAGVAHEISSPTACVMGNRDCLQERVSALARFVELVEADADGRALQRAWRDIGGRALIGEIHEILDCLGMCSAQINAIVRDLKSLARGDTEPVPFDVNEAIRSALRVAGAELKHRARVATDLGAGVVVVGNAGRLTQVFVNLLVNAVQACGKGAATACAITIRSARAGDRVVVRVSDDGPGIHPQHVSRIFDSFFTTKGSHGTGLGLAICRDIVRGHGGTIHVESDLGHGATFVVDLPFAAGSLI